MKEKRIFPFSCVRLGIALVLAHQVFEFESKLKPEEQALEQAPCMHAFEPTMKQAQETQVTRPSKLASVSAGRARYLERVFKIGLFRNRYFCLLYIPV